MSKKLIILIVLVGVMAGMFLFQGSDFNVPNEEVEEEKVISDEEIDQVLSLIKENTPESFTDEYGDFVKKEYLINLVHITKDDSGYKIECFFGPSYENANLIKIFPEKLVSMGQIKECNLETAKLIDEAVKSEEMECDVFTGNIPLTLDDYYFFAIKMKDQEVTQEWIDYYVNEKWSDSGENILQCFKAMEKLIGETIAKHGTGIVDLDENYLYY